MPRFFEGLKPFVNEDERQQHNIYSFKILDLDRDGILNVINLMTLYKGFP